MQLKNLSMSYGIQTIFEDVNLYIPDDEKIGVVGVNGAGKTTLFKVLMNIEEPTSGKVIFKNGARVNWLAQVLSDDAKDMNETVLDYLMSGRPIKELNDELAKCYEELANDAASEKIIYQKIDKIQKKLEVLDQYNAENILLEIIEGMNINDDLLYKKLNELSGGQKSKVAFAKLLYSNPDVMLLDEPTNHLDSETREYVTNFLKNYNNTVLIISHDTKFLDEVTTKTLFLDKRTKSFSLFDGNYSSFIKQEEARELALEREAASQQKEEDKLRAIVEKYKTSSGKRKKMAQDREKKLEKLLENKIEAPLQNKQASFTIDLETEENNYPIEISNLSFKYDSNSPNNLINNLTFTLGKGEKFLIVGENGAGKSTLLKLIVGSLSPLEGQIKKAPKTKIAYYAQELETLDVEKSIFDNFYDTNLNNKEIRSLLSKFLFTGDEVFKKVKVLSPGEKARVALAKLVVEKANLLVLDEPTNHLDPQTQKLIGEVFSSFKGSMIVVSHNPDFVDTLNIERLLILPEGKIKYYDKEIVMHYHEINNKNKIH